MYNGEDMIFDNSLSSGLESFINDLFNEDDIVEESSQSDDLKSYSVKQINSLLSKWDILEIKISLNDSSYSVNFFVTINGKRRQCLDLVDDGIISEKKYEAVEDAIVKYARTMPDYKPGTINKYSFVVKK